MPCVILDNVSSRGGYLQNTLQVVRVQREHQHHQDDESKDMILQILHLFLCDKPQMCPIDVKDSWFSAFVYLIVQNLRC